MWEQDTRGAEKVLERGFESCGGRSIFRNSAELLEQPINNRMVSANPGIMADQENVKQLRSLRWDKLPNPCDRIDALAAGFEILLEEPALSATGDPGYSLKFDSRPASYTRVDTANSFSRLR